MNILDRSEINQVIFVNRDLELETCLENLKRHPFLCIYGFEGIGKTALLKQLCSLHLKGKMIALKEECDAHLLIELITKLNEESTIYIDNVEWVRGLDFKDFIKLLQRKFEHKRFVFSSSMDLKIDHFLVISKLSLFSLSKSDSLSWLNESLVFNHFPLLSHDDLESFYGVTLGFPRDINAFINQLLHGLDTIDQIIASDSEYMKKRVEYIDRLMIQKIDSESLTILMYAAHNQGKISSKELVELISSKETTARLKYLISTAILKITAPGFFSIEPFMQSYCLTNANPLLNYQSKLTQLKLRHLQESDFNNLKSILALAKSANCSKTFIDSLLKTHEKFPNYHCKNPNFCQDLEDLLEQNLDYRYQELLLLFIELQFDQNPQENLIQNIKKIQDSSSRFYYLGYLDFVLNQSKLSNQNLYLALETMTDTNMIFRIHTMIAYNQFSLGENELATKHFDHAQSLIAEITKVDILANYYKYKSAFLGFCGKYDQSLKELYLGINLAKTHSLNILLLDLLWFESYLLSNQMKLKESRVICEQAMKIAKDLNDVTSMISLYDQIAHIHFIEEKFSKSLQAQQSAINLCLDSKQDHRGAELYCRLASIQSRQLDFKEAKLNFEKSYLFLARFDNPTQKLFNDLNYCEYLLLTEQVELAIKKLIDLVKASQEAGLLETKIHALYYLSKAYHLQCDLQKQSIIDQEYQSNLLQLELEAQSQLINDMRWFENYISKQMNHIVLMSNQIITTISERQMQKSEQQTLDFCLYINFVTQEAYYFQEKLALFSKKILVKVLLYLIKNHKRQVDSQELYQAIWKKHYNPEIDSTLRVNMIRLRALLLDSQHKKLITSPKRNTYQIILPKSYRILYQDLDQKMKE